jgi:hypothetical protein
MMMWLEVYQEFLRGEAGVEKEDDEPVEINGYGVWNDLKEVFLFLQGRAKENHNISGMR